MEYKKTPKNNKCALIEAHLLFLHAPCNAFIRTL